MIVMIQRIYDYQQSKVEAWESYCDNKYRHMIRMLHKNKYELLMYTTNTQ